MSVFVSATVDIGDVEKGFDALQRRAHALLPVMKGLKKPTADDQKEHAKAKAGPDSAWAPRVPYHKMPRKQLGRLPTAVSYKALPHSLIGESKVAWSQVQQEGGRVGRGVMLPARPFLWLSDKLVAIAADAISQALASAFVGH